MTSYTAVYLDDNNLCQYDCMVIMKTKDVEYINQLIEKDINRPIYDDDEYFIFEQDPILVSHDIGIVENPICVYSIEDMLEWLYKGFVNEKLISKDKWKQLHNDYLTS